MSFRPSQGFGGHVARYNLFTNSLIMESILQKALKIFLDKFGAEYDCVTISETNGHYCANIETNNAARIIGKNGATLSAIQLLLKNILYTQNGENIFVTVDVDGYLKQQEDKRIAIADRYIETMREKNLAEIKLPPMKALFRRIVHLHVVNNYPELQTDSVGEGMERAVRVSYK